MDGWSNQAEDGDHFLSAGNGGALLAQSASNGVPLLGYDPGNDGVMFSDNLAGTGCGRLAGVPQPPLAERQRGFAFVSGFAAASFAAFSAVTRWRVSNIARANRRADGLGCTMRTIE